MHNSFVEPSDLSPLIELTLSIGDAVSLIAKVLCICVERIREIKEISYLYFVEKTRVNTII